MSSERKMLQEKEKEKMEMSQPLNMFDLESERKQAARIIDMVNKKTKGMKKLLNEGKSAAEIQKALKSIDK